MLDKIINREKIIDALKKHQSINSLSNKDLMIELQEFDILYEYTSFCRLLNPKERVGLKRIGKDEKPKWEAFIMAVS